MAASAYTKMIQTALLALQSVAASSVAVSSAFDMQGAANTGKLGGIIHARLGRRAATAAGAGANIRIESSSSAAGNNWFPFAVFTSNFAACEGEAVNGACASGQNVVPVASTTNLVAGDVIFIDNSTIANSEWGRIKSISAGVSVTLEDNLANTQTGSTLYDAAEIYTPVRVPAECVRIRAVADGALFTQAFAVEVNLITVDSIGA